jgi:hypothetical protein
LYHNSTHKPKKEASSLHVSDKGLQIQQSPHPSTCWEDQVDVTEVSDQENTGIIDITNGPTSTDEVWTVVKKKKKEHVTSQPMVA